MTVNGLRNVVEQTLNLASNGQIVESFALINAPHVNQTGDVEMCRLLFKSCNAMRAGSLEIGIREALLAIKHLERSGYKYLLDWAYSIVGVSFGMLGSPEVGLEWADKAFAGAEDRSDEGQMWRSLCDKGRLLWILDKEDEAVAVYEKALHLRNAPISVDEKTGLLNELAETHLCCARRHDQAEEARSQQAEWAYDCARAALTLVETTGESQVVARSLANLGGALAMLGKLTEAEDSFKRALSLAGLFPRIQTELLVNYAWMLCDAKRFDEAGARLAEAYDQAQAASLDDCMNPIFETRIRLELLAGNTAEALRWSKRQVKFLERRYRQRLAVIARNAEIFIDVERTRLSERRNKIQTGAVAAIQTPGSQPGMDQNEPLSDSLTGCFNRHGFAIHAEAMFIPGGRAALAMVGTDHFTSINDRYGHAVGAKVLQEIGKIFSDSLRNSDLVARYENEEFVVLLHGIGPEIAWGICERLRLAVEHHGWAAINAGLHVTVSIGVSAREHDETLEALTTLANNAILRAKAEGYNRVIAG